ncbi:MAG: hypothetical protein JW915_03600 [Chitinispirillaceae bacterium]|nr:hypothetical protein [Chitinispirillaceae bacterium]
MALSIAETPILSGDEVIHFTSTFNKAGNILYRGKNNFGEQEIYHAMEKSGWKLISPV